METHFTFSDEEFELQFREKNLNPSLFTHEAHLRLAWIHIRKYGVEKAIENICWQINAFATFHGDKDKFHLTITVVAIRVVQHFILKSSADNFNDFINENLRLKTDFKALLASHYSVDLFKSEIAKSKYLEPDLLPFD